MRKSINLKVQLLINFVTSYISTFFSIGIQFFFIPFLIATIGLNNYGLYSLFLFFSLSGGLSLFDFGLQGTVVKFIAGGISLNDNKRVTKYVVESAILFLVIGLVAALGVLVVNYFFFQKMYHVGYVSQNFILLFAVSSAVNLLVDFIFIQASAIYEATMRKDILDVLNTAKSIFFTVAVCFFFYFNQKSLETVIVLSVLANFLFTIVALVKAYNLVKPYFTKQFVFRFADIFSLFNLSKDLFVSRFVGFLDSQLPRIVISFLLPIKFLGVYDLVMRVVGVIRTLGGKITQIGLIGYSSMLQEKEDRFALQRLFMNITKYSFLIIMPFILPIFFFAEPLLRFWLKLQYVPIEYLVKLYLFQLILSTTINVGGIMLVGLHRVRAILKLSIIIFSLSALAMFTVTYFKGLDGMAVTAVISSMVLVPLYLSKLLKEFDLKFVDFFNITLKPHIVVSFLVSAVLMAISFFYSPHTVIALLVLLASAVFLYFILYFFLATTEQEKGLLKEKIFSKFIRKKVPGQL